MDVERVYIEIGKYKSLIHDTAPGTRWNLNTLGINGSNALGAFDITRQGFHATANRDIAFLRTLDTSRHNTIATTNGSRNAIRRITHDAHIDASSTGLGGSRCSCR